MIRELRLKKGYPLRKVAAFLDIDQAILSKMERGIRRFSKEQVIRLAEFFNYDKKKMLTVFLSDSVLMLLGDDENSAEVLKAAEEKVRYLAKKQYSGTRIVSILKNYFSKNEKIRRAWLFGSYARGESDRKSDLDIMVEVYRNKHFSLFDLAEVQDQLERRFSCKIDLVMKRAVKPSVMKRIEKDMILIYER